MITFISSTYNVHGRWDGASERPSIIFILILILIRQVWSPRSFWTVESLRSLWHVWEAGLNQRLNDFSVWFDRFICAHTVSINGGAVSVLSTLFLKCKEEMVNESILMFYCKFIKYLTYQCTISGSQFRWSAWIISEIYNFGIHYTAIWISSLKLYWFHLFLCNT